MEGVIITDTMKRYAKECLEAAKSSPRPSLSAEEMREQVRRNHEEVSMRRKNSENKDGEKAHGAATNE